MYVRAVDLTDVVHPAHVGMGDLARDAHLAVKTREQPLVARHRFRQELERDRLIELQV